MLITEEAGVFREYQSQKCNTYFTNIEKLYTASNDDSFLFSKQIQELADELLQSVPKGIDETGENIITPLLFGGVK